MESLPSMNYNEYFNIDPLDVKKEIKAIKREKLKSGLRDRVFEEQPKLADKDINYAYNKKPY